MNKWLPGRRFRRLYGHGWRVGIVSIILTWVASTPFRPLPPQGSAVAAAVPGPSLEDRRHHFDKLDPLRIDAWLGNMHASAELAQLLVARFEVSGQQEDLHEALQWIARDWDQSGYPGYALVQHVVLRHCPRSVLRWHPLCVSGE
jgi:hypothetical protein